MSATSQASAFEITPPYVVNLMTRSVSDSPTNPFRNDHKFAMLYEKPSFIEADVLLVHTRVRSQHPMTESTDNQAGTYRAEETFRNGARKSSGLRSTSNDEPRRHLTDWDLSYSEHARDETLAALIEAQADRTPQAIAVVNDDQQITFEDLNQRANRLAYYLRQQGAGPDHLVGVCIERSVHTIVTLLAVLKAGAAYLAIDPLLPPERIRFIQEDSQFSLLVTTESLLPLFSSVHGEAILLERDPWQESPAENLAVTVEPHHLAYLIYTSGSTGKPKGVEIPRGALLNFLFAMQDLLHLSEQDRVLAITTFSFDIAALEIWLPLLAGAQMVLVSRDDATDGQRLSALIEQHDITLLQATPVTWRFLFLAGWKGRTNMQAICGGEPMPRDLALQLAPAVSLLWNMYGPTETTVWSTAYPVINPHGPILIGRPIANTHCYVLDSERQPVPTGVTGELYIGGDGLARGYRNRPELTAAAFLPDPFAGGETRMYRTGDLARFDSDANIECLGRIDHQMKLHGHRIEPGEIEATLRDIPGITDAAVSLWHDAAGDERLVAYLVTRSDSSPETLEVIRRLKLFLPSYMVPSIYERIASLPVSANGKIDRKALPAPLEKARSRSELYEPPRDAVEETLAKIWRDVLSIERVGIHDNYFELGGDSLLAVQLILKIRQAFPESKPSLTTFWRAPTIAEFALTLNTDSADWSCLVPIRHGTARPPLFCVHGAGGNWMSLRPLALALPREQPFYCLQAQGLDGRTSPFSTVEDAAESYLDHIRQVQPHGPYHLAGGCFGGLVAYEMACRLRSMGETVSVLALIDTENHAYSQLIPKGRVLYFKVRFLIRRTIHHFQELERIDPARRFQYLRRRARIGLSALMDFAQSLSQEIRRPSRTDSDKPEVDFEKNDGGFQHTLDVVREASMKAGQSFVPKPFRGDVLIFRAKQRPDDPYADSTLGWDPVVFGTVSAYEIDADHNTIFTHPAIQSVAQILDAAITAKELDRLYRI